jgi:hypothetical protein
MIGHSGISNASDWLIVQQYLTKVYNPPDGIRISAHDDVFMGGGGRFGVPFCHECLALMLLGLSNELP